MGAAVQWPWGQCARVDTEELGQANCELKITYTVVLIDLLLILVNRISIVIKAGFEGIGQLLNPNGGYSFLLAGGDGPYLVSSALGEEDHCLGWIECHVAAFPRTVQPAGRSGAAIMTARRALTRLPMLFLVVVRLGSLERFAETIDPFEEHPMPEDTVLW